MKTGKVKPAPVSDGKLIRRVNLEDADWARVSWRNLPLPPLPPARPFDPVSIRSHVKESFRNWEVRHFEMLEIPLAVTKEEAWLWLHVFEVFNLPFGTSRAGQEFEEKALEALPSDGEIRRKIESTSIWYTSRLAPQILLPFFSPHEMAELIFREMKVHDAKHQGRAEMNFANFEIISKFHERIYLRMIPEERRIFSDALELRCKQWEDDPGFVAEFTRIFLAVIQGGPRLASFVARQADGAWENPHQAVGTLETLAGLANEEEFVREARRVVKRIQPHLGRRTLSDVKLWLAATEFGLECLRACTLRGR